MIEFGQDTADDTTRAKASGNRKPGAFAGMVYGRKNPER